MIGCRKSIDQRELRETSADPGRPGVDKEITGVVLVTGATGFIGRRLVDALEGRREVAIRVLTRDAAKGRTLWPDDTMTVVAADLGSPQAIGDACTGVQTLFHLAGHAHAEDEGRAGAEALHERITVAGTRNLLDAAVRAGVQRVVFVSSVKAMGEQTNSCADETVEPRPTSGYGRAKLEAERNVLEVARRHRIHACVLRLPLVYGPGVKGNLKRMIEAVECGRFPPLAETGNKRSMVHVHDVVEATLLAATLPRANGHTYIVTDGCAYSTHQIYSLMCQALGKRVPRWSMPIGILRTIAKTGDAIGYLRGRRFVFDSDALQKLLGSAWYSSQKIENELGFRPAQTLENSVGEMVAEYKRAKDSGLGTKDFGLR